VNCDELIGLLMDYLDGDLVEEQATLVRVHLGGCQNCTFYLESYTHTVRVVKKLPRCERLPDRLEARLRDALKDHLG
jgi:hypothetical protein